MTTPSTAIPGAIPFIIKDEDARAFHASISPYPLDTSNRALKWYLLSGGHNPDANPFRTTPIPKFNLKNYGCVLDGVSDDSDGFEEAVYDARFGGEIVWPVGLPTFTRTIPLSGNQTITGHGPGKAAIQKAHTGDCFEIIGSNVLIRNLTINGLGATQAGGRGIYISGGQNTRILNSWITDTYDPAIEFAEDVGLASFIDACHLVPYRQGASGVAAIKTNDDDAATPRFFSKIYSGPAMLLDINGSWNVEIEHCYGNFLKMAGAPVGFVMSVCRIANSSLVTITTTSGVFIGNEFGGDVTLDAANNGLKWARSNIVAGTFIDGTTPGNADVEYSQYPVADVHMNSDIIATGGYRQRVCDSYQDNSGASQTAVALTRIEDSTADYSPNVEIMQRAGSITGIWVKSNAARTAGTLTVQAYKNGSAVATCTAVLDANNTTFKFTSFAKDVLAFAAGDELDIRVTTDGSWTPTTADIRSGLEVET